MFSINHRIATEVSSPRDANTTRFLIINPCLWCLRIP